MVNDSELREFVSGRKTKISVIGLGGAGKNTLNTLNDLGITGVTRVAVNTDAQDLLNSKVDNKVLIGREHCRGLGAGNDPSNGRDACIENLQDVRNIVEGQDAVFLTCGLGGGTGTGSIPVVAELCKKLGVLSIAVVSLPFEAEGQSRMDNANAALLDLEKKVDCIIVIPNEKLLDLAPDLPLATAFKVVDDVLAGAIKGIVELVTKPGLVNLDFADMKSVMKHGGIGVIGLGESDSMQKSHEAVDKALSNPLLEVDLYDAQAALINITGGRAFTLNEATDIVDKVSTKLNENARLIWGAQIDHDLGDKIKVLVVVTGLGSKALVDAKAVEGYVEVNDLF